MTKYEMFEQIIAKHKLSNKYDLFHYLSFFEDPIKNIIESIIKIRTEKEKTRGQLIVAEKINLDWKIAKNGIFLYHEDHLYYFSRKKMEIRVKKSHEIKITTYGFCHVKDAKGWVYKKFVKET